LLLYDFTTGVAAEWLGWKETVSKNLSMDMDVLVGGRVVEIKGESCVDAKHRLARDAATAAEKTPSRRGMAGAGLRQRRAVQFRVTHRFGSLVDVGKRGAESLKCNCRVCVEEPGVLPLTNTCFGLETDFTWFLSAMGTLSMEVGAAASTRVKQTQQDRDSNDAVGQMPGFQSMRLGRRAIRETVGPLQATQQFQKSKRRRILGSLSAAPGPDGEE